ncbi:GNAT family N-acetyltransferase [Colwellia sp. MB02u-9]|uniref:GNAT family N-acetyltransferase n=1 Tax=Colwellia sp. MB02u-9 TaxID=2759823 RepID=UPI0015F37A14|nr:GNAT family N-acetyltransferase [Colwellia sp. MB02u-9]MBA6296143.1 GNAT family N-acetyltransferase [Colwellia sp. MB02u-9]
MTEKLTSDHKNVTIGDLEITIRPITPEDKHLEAAFVKKLSMQTKYERFFEGLKELSPSMLNVLSNIDYVDTMAYIATIKTEEGEKEVGMCRYAADKVPGESEMAITVADDYPYEEVATVLLHSLFEHAKANNIKRLFSIELSSNYRIKKLAEHLGMSAKVHPEDATLILYSLLLK